MKRILVCLDRDGTINFDDDFYLGRESNWKEKTKIIEGVVPGIKMLNGINGLDIFIITNQSGVALDGDEYRELNEARAHEVNRYILELLRKEGAIIRDYFMCPYVNSVYVEKANAKGKTVNHRYVVDECRDRKPNPGMIEKAASSLGLTLNDCDIYVIGDRKNDVDTAVTIGGYGILIPNNMTIRIGDVEKLKGMKEFPSRVHIARDFLEASKHIIARLEQ